MSGNPARKAILFKGSPGVLAYKPPFLGLKNRGFGHIDMYVNPAVDLVLIAAVYAALSQALQVFFLDRRGQRTIQKESAAINKKFQELMKKGNQADPKEMESVQREQAEVTGKMMKRMPKQMIGSLILYLPFLELVRTQYGMFNIFVFFPFHYIWKVLDGFWYFVLASFIISIVVGQALTWRETHHEKKNQTPTHQPIIHT